MGIFDKLFGEKNMTPRDADAWNNKGIDLCKIGKYEEAAACFEKVVEIDSRDHVGWFNKGDSLYKLGKHHEAMRCFDNALEIKPLFAMAWGNKGTVLNDLGRYDEAISVFNKALEINPMDIVAWNNKGYSLFKIGRYKEALSCYDKALQIDPNDIKAQNNKKDVKKSLEDEDKNLEIRGEQIGNNSMKDLNAIETLIEALNDKNDTVRLRVVETLGNIGGKRVVDSLIHALKDEYYHVRREAAEALGKIGDERAIEPLIQTLKNDKYSADIRDKSIRALGMIGNKRAVKPLIQALKDESPSIRAEAAEALGNIGDENAIEPLSQALKDENQYVQETAVLALEKIKDNKSKEPLIKAKRENEETGNIKSGEESATEKSHQPKFLRKEHKVGIGGDATYEIYQGKDAESVRAFLLTKRIDKKLYYIIVETPEGNWGMDVEGLFLEQLLSWQTNINSADCEGSIIPMSWSMFGLGSAAREQNDNFIAKVRCGKCEHEWLDGVRYKNFTVVRCSQCKTLNKVNSNNIEVWQV